MEYGKPPEEVKLQEKVLPSRDEYRKILKTGKGSDGYEAHPQDVKDLRRASLGDLKSMGNEFNIILKELKSYIDILSTNSSWALLQFTDFLIEEGVLKEGASDRFDEFVAKRVQAEVEKKKQDLEKQKALSEIIPTVVTVDEIKKKNESKED